MPPCLIGLGSNLGDRAAQLRRAVEELGHIPGLDVRAVSAWHETEPIGGPAGQGKFLNGAVRAESHRSPLDLLRAMQAIERRLGRGPHARWEARPVDLDLLLYGDLVIETSVLRVPHPWMAIRRFVVGPACEVGPDMVHPLIGWTVRRLWEHLSLPHTYVAVTGIPGAGKSALIRRVLAQQPGQWIEGPAPTDRADGPNRNSSGQTRETEIEFLRRRTQLLRRSGAAAHELRISDFWIRQSLAYGRLWLTGTRYDDLRQAVSECCEDVQSQKLLVLVQVRTEGLGLARASRRGGQAAAPIGLQGHWATLQRGLQTEAARPGQGPLLRLDAGDMPRAVADLLAAVRAMT